MNLKKFPRHPLTFGPSPIQPLKRLSAHLGGKVALYAKREDCNSGLAFGGNKTRKLEYLIPEALEGGYDTLVSIGGVRREFDAEIGDQVPDQHVTWRSVGDVTHRGRVAFAPAGTDSTRVDLEIEWEPEGFTEHAGAALQLDDLQVKTDLKKFKEFIEGRYTPTGAWRGEIHGGEATRRDSGSIV